jgi:hypothetical protein
MMREIIIDGVKWWYKNTSNGSGRNYQSQTSFFKSPTITKKYKKYLFFGPVIEVKIENTKADFNIFLNVDDPSNTKEKIKAVIDQKMILLKRKKEIDNNEII